MKECSINIAKDKIANAQIILNYHRTNGLFKKIVDLVATDSLRKGITISGDSDKIVGELKEIGVKKVDKMEDKI